MPNPYQSRMNETKTGTIPKRKKTLRRPKRDFVLSVKNPRNGSITASNSLPISRSSPARPGESACVLTRKFKYSRLSCDRQNLIYQTVLKLSDACQVFLYLKRHFFISLLYWFPLL